MKAFVIGSQEAVLGFSLVGVRGRPASTPEQLEAALDAALATPDIGIVLVTADAARLSAARMEHLKLRSTVPLVVEIPGPEGVSPDQPSLSEVVLRAIGIKL
jgi:V/A-type H+-transporting ATPase subunit F